MLNMLKPTAFSKLSFSLHFFLETPVQFWNSSSAKEKLSLFTDRSLVLFQTLMLLFSIKQNRIIIWGIITQSSHSYVAK